MLQKVVSLSDQLKNFQEYKNKLKVIVGEEKANFLVKNSLYLVVASSNDIAHTYTARSIKYNKTSYADYLADSASKFVSVSTKFDYVIYLIYLAFSSFLIFDFI